MAICGAAPMPVELLRRFEAAIGVRVLEGYGLTEAGCVSSLNLPGSAARPGSIGVRLPWQRMHPVILDADGRYLRDAEIDEVGVIAVLGPNLFGGYLDATHNRDAWIERPESTGAIQLWLNTGDLGRVDAEGYFWLVGRKKELIIRGGHNIDPRTIEEVLHQHPSVALAAAVGRPDVRAGELPIAYVQLRPGAQASTHELREFAESRIGERAAWPKQLRVVVALPMTAVGKIFKPALVQREIESVVREEAELGGVVLDALVVEHHPRLGIVEHWRAAIGAATLRERLERYAFRNEEMTKDNA
jgi:acyl-CoA synthetase (AMP-forming)/AMP-acid ligase II